MPTKEEYEKNILYYKTHRKTEASKAANRRWAEKNTHKRDNYARYRRYKISLDEYNALLQAADSRCALCNRVVERLALDHNHDTGEIRKFLCYGCNTGLGHFGDSVDLLEKAIAYLKSFGDGVGS